MTRIRTLLLSMVMGLAFWSGTVQAGELADGFAHPPADARPMVRWWWFGPNVQDNEIVREIHAMKEGGFGGFELQTVYPLSLEGNMSFLSDAHLRAIRLANETARAEGLRVDLTLGSGWPFGGPNIPIDLASTAIKLVQISVPPKAVTVDLPELQAGESRIAVFVGTDMASARPVEPAGNRVAVPAADGGETLFVVLQEPTGQQVKRAAIGAEGNVLDHMSKAATETHLRTVGDKLISAFGNRPPYAIFSDSLEVYGADWTSDFLTEFQKRRGYDLKPHLLDIFSGSSDGAAVRHDWGLTLAELTEDNYLAPLANWAHRHDTRLRSQTYGTPPVRLSSNRFADLAEGEGPQWREFSPTRWASSANHIYGKTVTSAESWTWLHDGAFRATPLDIKAEADAFMLEGVNQFVAHGWPYSPPSVPEPGWAFYAAAVFNDHNPWWGVMADVNRYLQRMSYLLRQGEPVADVAVLLPEDDAFAEMKPGAASVSDYMKRNISKGLISRILDGGYGFDFVSGQTILDKGLTCKVLILPRVTRIAPDVFKRIKAYADAGGTVLAVDGIPSQAPGFLGADRETAVVRALGAKLFDGKHGIVVTEAEVGAKLNGLVTPDMTGAPPQFGFVHRHLPRGELYFVANTGNQTVTARLRFRDGTGAAQWWDARSGEAHDWKGGPVTLAPYESRIFVFGADASAPVVLLSASRPQPRVLSTGWSIAFGNEPAHALNAFVSWTDMPGREYYSGVVTYTRALAVTAKDIAAGLTTLDFGAGQALDPVPPRGNGTHALLVPPVREAAEVYVDGKRAGAVWTAPFSISLRGLLHPGVNRLEIRVGNTAINLLSGRPPVNYAALNAKYGERFQAQNMDNLKPLPSGILQPPALLAAP